jgi:hypothetical protein
LLYWLYAQNGSTSDETHDFQTDGYYGAQGTARLPSVGMKAEGKTLRKAKSLVSYNVIVVVG